MEYFITNPLLLFGIGFLIMVGAFIYFVSKEMDNLP